MSNMTGDLFGAWFLVLLLTIVSFAYAVRVLRHGRAQFDRVDRQAASPLLGKRTMEGAYWFFQWLGRGLVVCRVTANQISWAALTAGLIAGFCLAFGHFGFAAGFATISAILDALDGYVARLTQTDSDAGEILDASIDRYVEFFFIGGLVVYYREIPFILILALFALLGSFMVSYSTAKAEALKINADLSNSIMRRPERAAYLIAGAAFSPITIASWYGHGRWLAALENAQEWGADRDFAVGLPMVLALALVAVLANFSAIERLCAIARVARVSRTVRSSDAAGFTLEGVKEDPLLK